MISDTNSDMVTNDRNFSIFVW